jgi:hypothetical protein
MALASVLLLPNPRQSVLSHWTSWDVKAAKESNADAFKPD